MAKVSKNPKNYIEIHCYLESDRGAKYDAYELSIRIGNTDFEQADSYKGRSTAMRAAKRISATTGLPVVENKE